MRSWQSVAFACSNDSGTSDANGETHRMADTLAIVNSEPCEHGDTVCFTLSINRSKSIEPYTFTITGRDCKCYPLTNATIKRISDAVAPYGFTCSRYSKP